MTGVVDNEDHRPRHMARPPTDAHPATQESPLVGAGEDGDGDGEKASVLPATRRPSWPASRRARAVARRRGRAVVSGPAPDAQGAAPAAPASPAAPSVAPAPPSRGRSP
ncbi:MAG TPA: hypothetical protein VFG94_11940, partial [Acidimicrobiales bacterium]|nr:hypothetical protein [Acidimicrobiales bacterium]